MLRSKFALVVVCTLVASSFLVSVANATPPQTRVLPVGSKLYSLSCDGIEGAGVRNGQLASVNTVTGVNNKIGSGTTHPEASSVDGGLTGCAIGATYNPVTHTAYWFNWKRGDESRGGNSSQLFTIDTTTGNSTYIGELTPGINVFGSGATYGNLGNLVGIATNASGNMYAFWFGNSDTHLYVGLVNQKSGSISAVHQVGNDATDSFFNSENLCSFTYNPVDNKFYVTGYAARLETSHIHLYGIDVTSGAIISDVASGWDNTGENCPFFACGTTVDENGVMWSVSYAFLSATVGGWSTPDNLQWIPLPNPFYYTQALFIAPASGDNGAAAATAAAAAAAAQRQRELTEILGLVPSIASLALNIGDLTNSLLAPKKSISAKQKCVKGSSTKYIKKGSKCPTGYKKK